MRFLLLGLNYAPEPTGIGKYSGEMMEWLAARGHEVRVITTPPYYPAWRVTNGYRWWKYKNEKSLSGIQIDRCPLWVPERPSGLKRVVHLASFALSSLPVALSMVDWHPDIVFTVEPAFTGAPVAILTACLAGTPAWLHVQDFEVDVAFELGLLPAGGFIQSCASVLERFLLRGFSCYSSISPRMIERLQQKGVDPEQILLFPNWVDLDAIYPIAGPNPIRAELGIPKDKVVLLYSGNMGMKQGLEVLPRLASEFSHDPNLHFLFCGDGAYRPELERMAAGSANVSLLPLQPVERLNDLLNAADIHLLPQRAGAADLVMPSKLTGMLASGRPTIAMANRGTQIASAVEGCGVVGNAEDFDGLRDAVSLLAGNKDLRQQMGRAARAFAEEELGREQILTRFEHHLLRIAG